MRKSLGFAILGLGVAVLGWWAQGHDAVRIQQLVSDEAAQVVAGSIHGATTTVSGRDIRLGGILNGAEEQTALLGALNALPGRRVVTSEATVLEKVAPFTLEVVKADGLTATGFVPTESARAALAAALGDAAAGLTLAAGAPAGWDAMAMAGLAALGPLASGTLTLADGDLNISGQALGPTEGAAVDAALAALPPGSWTTEIALLDDGKPAAYTIDYSAADGASIAGKLPKGLDVAAIASAMGLRAITGTVTQGMLDDATDAGMFGAFKGVLAEMETLKISVAPGKAQVAATVQGDVDAPTVKAALVEGLGAFGVATDSVSVAVAPIPGENGTTRVNAATGANQRYMGDYWLDVPQITVGMADCQAAVDRVLAEGTINFVTNSDQLGDGAFKVINSLGAVMILCAEQGKLRALIGGHTDSSGSAEANLGLSQRRAVTVRRELMARGVDGSSLKAVGYGAAKPVADNATDNGKARNRRTTIEWSQ